MVSLEAYCHRQKTKSLLCYKDGYLNSVYNAVDQWWRSEYFGAEPI